MGLRTFGATGSGQGRRGSLSFSSLLLALCWGATACGRSPGGVVVTADGAAGDAAADATPPSASDAHAGLGLDLPPPGPAPDSLSVGAKYVVSLGAASSADNGRTSVSAMFFSGGGDCEISLCHTTTQAPGLPTVNGVPLNRQTADWGIYYSSDGVLDPTDGVYLFRLDRGSTTVVRSVQLRRVTPDLTAGTQLRAGSNTITWSPALPSTDGLTVSLESSCVTAMLQGMTSSSATFSLEPSQSPCQTHFILQYRSMTPIGPPFTGGNIWTAADTRTPVVVVK